MAENKGFFYRLYDKNYKQLLLIPFIIIVLAAAQISFQFMSTGDFINKGVSLKGGTSVTAALEDTDTKVDVLALESFLRSEFKDNEIDIREISDRGMQLGLIIETDIVDEVDLFLEKVREKVPDADLSVEQMGPTLGDSFFRETLYAILIAFIFMGIVVFLYFRLPVPSGAVILAAFSDILVTIAVVNILNIKISTAGIAAFLMLIGYSVDTDILLSTRVLKRSQGTVLERVIDAMKTGLTMNFTTMGAIIVGLMFSQSEVLKQIMTILLIGLIVDIIMTWIQNAGILRWYMEKNGKD